MVRRIARLGLRGVAVLGLLFFVFCPTPGRATNFSWNVNAGGAFDAGGNWAQSGLPVDSDGVPDASDIVTFRRGSGVGVAVNFPGTGHGGTTPVNYVTDRLLVGSNAVSFADVPLGAASTYAAGNVATDESGRGIIIGVTGGDTAAVLNTTLPSFSGAAATIGDAAGSSGTLNVNAGTFSVIGSSVADDELIVGNHGAGALNANNGADVTLSGVNGDSVLGKNLGSSGTATISGSGSTWTNGLSLTVAYSGTGTLNVTNGGEVSNVTGYIGSQSGSTGLASVGGANSKWTNSSELTIGYAGTGTLAITAGGYVTGGNGLIGRLPGSMGDVTVDGLGSIWTSSALSVGNQGNGTLAITNKGQVHNPFGAVIADYDTSTAAATVDGIGSIWTNDGGLNVGGGHGTLAVTNGGQVNSGAAAIAINGGSSFGEVTVNGPGSKWTISGPLYVCSEGNGTLNVTNGGQVQVNNSGNLPDAVKIAKHAGATGTVNVDGTGSMLTTVGNVQVGDRGSGAIHITAGGAVHNTGTSYIGNALNSTGEVTIDGLTSEWSNTGDVYVGNLGTGTLTIKNSGLASATNVIVNALGSIHGNGKIVANVQNGGLVSPGTSPGVLDIFGDYTQTAGGKLLIELASGSFDQLRVTNTATLMGSLTVNLLGGFTPSVGQSFTIITSDDVDGAFDVEMLPSLPGLTFDVIYNATTIVLDVIPSLPGDYNRNGVVDAADYPLWRHTLGQPVGRFTGADGNGSGAIDTSDYDVWRAHVGQTLPGAGSGNGSAGALPSQAAVPEPSTVLLLVLAAAGAFLRRRTHCRISKLITA